MRHFTLTVIDTTGIQEYIFGSNSLKHNVGASALVHWATHDWVYELLADLGRTNVSLNGKLNEQCIETDGLTSELVYPGGGNTVIVFRNAGSAKEFTRRLTSRTLLDAPGLQLLVAHTDFDWDEDVLSKRLMETMEKVGSKKASRVHSGGLLGLGVTADCQYTGLPAVGKDVDGRRVSSEVMAKLEVFKAAHDRLIQRLPLNDHGIPRDFDDLGRTRGESSYIAVIHTDGNGIGRRVQAIADACPASKDNRAYINSIRAFSNSIENAASEALRVTVERLISSKDEDGKIGGVVEVRDKLIPFRPIVFGGDDVTFVCDGRLGLTLTEFYLRQVTAQPLSDGKPMSARAGVAVVKSHYPFARAYALAEELASSAKGYIKERQNAPFSELDLSTMDWHFAASGPVFGLEEIREKGYRVSEGWMTMRPLRLGESAGADWRTWETFTRIIKEFRDTNKEWSGRRNKIMALRDALRAGPNAVEQFVTAYKPHHVPEVPGYPESAKNGWIKDRCTCFDAIEALDFFVPLDEGGK